MSLQRIFLLGAALVLASAPPSRAEPKAPPPQVTTADDPAAIVSDLYRYTIKYDSSAWLYDASNRRLCLSKSLWALWAASDANAPPEGEVGTIDFDLMADTNGLQLTGFKVKRQERKGERATVDIELKYQEPYVHDGVHIVTYDLVREDGRWLVDNIRTKKWTVRDLLKAQADEKPAAKR